MREFCRFVSHAVIASPCDSKAKQSKTRESKLQKLCALDSSLRTKCFAQNDERIAIHRHTERDSAKYPNHANLKIDSRSITKANL